MSQKPGIQAKWSERMATITVHSNKNKVNQFRGKTLVP